MIYKKMEIHDLQENGIPRSTRIWNSMIYKKMEIHDLQENHNLYGKSLVTDSSNKT
jgi:hypothetical protein